MDIGLRLLTVILLISGAPAKAADAFIFAKVGTYDLEQADLTHDFVGWSLSDPIKVDTASTQSGSIGLEWQARDNWMLGFELYRMSHDWKAESGVSGELESKGVVFSGKYLFAPKSLFTPYVGAGLGFMSFDFGADSYWSDEISIAGHMGVGALMKFDYFSIYVEARHFETITFFSGYEFTGDGLYGGIRLGF